MIAKALFCLVAGLVMLLWPEGIMTGIGLSMDPTGLLMARLYGGALLGNFLVAWFSRNDTGSISLYAAVLYSFMFDGISFFITLWAAISGLIILAGWIIPVIFFAFTVGYAYHLFARFRIKVD